MKSLQLKESLAKAEAKVLKIKNTLAKHETKAQKMLAEIESKGWDASNVYCKEGTPEHTDAYWLICDYNSKLEDIESNKKKIIDAEKVVGSWMEKLEKQMKIEKTISFEMPDVFMQCKNDLTTDGVKWHKAEKEEMKKARNKMTYEDFRARYSYSQEIELDITDEQMKSKYSKIAEDYIIDLYNRIKAETGDVTSYEHIHYSNKGLNGFVNGELGNVRVETIVAGGYNIQRAHYRTLVKKIK